MLLTEIDHVAIAVRDLEAAIDYYERAFGATVAHREIVESDGVEEALLKVADSYIQLTHARPATTRRSPRHREARRGPAPRRLPGRRLRRRPRGDDGRRRDADRRRAAPGQPGHDRRVHPSEGQLRHADRARPGVSRAHRRARTATHRVARPGRAPRRPSCGTWTARSSTPSRTGSACEHELVAPLRRARGPTTTPARSSASTCSTRPRCCATRAACALRAARDRRAAARRRHRPRPRAGARGGPGARELLAELNAAGVPCALVTMSWRRLADAVVEQLPPISFQTVDHRRRGDERQAAPRAVPAAPPPSSASTRCVRRDRGLADRRARRPTAAGCVVVAVRNIVADPRGAGHRSSCCRRCKASTPELLGEFVERTPPPPARPSPAPTTGRRRRRPAARRTSGDIADGCSVRRPSLSPSSSSPAASGGSPFATPSRATSRGRSTSMPGCRTGRSTTPSPTSSRAPTCSTRSRRSGSRPPASTTIELDANTPDRRRPTSSSTSRATADVPLVGVDPRRHGARRDGRASSPTRRSGPTHVDAIVAFAADADFAGHRHRLRAVRLRRRPRHVGGDAPNWVAFIERARRPPARRRADAHRQHPAGLRRRADRRQRVLGLRLRRDRAARRRHPRDGLRLLGASDARPDRAARLGRRGHRRRQRRRRRPVEARPRHPAVRLQLARSPRAATCPPRPPGVTAVTDSSHRRTSSTGAAPTPVYDADDRRVVVHRTSSSSTDGRRRARRRREVHYVDADGAQQRMQRSVDAGFGSACPCSPSATRTTRVWDRIDEINATLSDPVTRRPTAARRRPPRRRRGDHRRANDDDDQLRR